MAASALAVQHVTDIFSRLSEKDQGFALDFLSWLEEKNNGMEPQRNIQDWSHKPHEIDEDECPLLGIAIGSSLTVEKFLEMTREDRILEGLDT